MATKYRYERSKQMRRLTIALFIMLVWLPLAGPGLFYNLAYGVDGPKVIQNMVIAAAVLTVLFAFSLFGNFPWLKRFEDRFDRWAKRTDENGKELTFAQAREIRRKAMKYRTIPPGARP